MSSLSGWVSVGRAEREVDEEVEGGGEMEVVGRRGGGGEDGTSEGEGEIGEEVTRGEE